MTSGRTIDGKFAAGTSGNPAGRPKGRSRAAEIRKQLETHVDEAVEVLLKGVRSGDSTCLKLYFERVCPRLRDVDMPVEVPGLSHALTIQEQVTAILGAVEKGYINATEALTLMQVCHNAVSIEGATELKERLEQLEFQENQKTREPFTVHTISAGDEK